MDQQRVAAGSNNMPSMRRSSSINLSCHFKSVCPSPDQPSPTLRYRSLLLVSLEWPNRHLPADTARQEDSVVGVGCIRPAWFAAHVLRPAVRPSALHPPECTTYEYTREPPKNDCAAATKVPSTVLRHYMGTPWDCAMAREATLRAVVAIEERILTKELVLLAESGRRSKEDKSVGRELIRVSSFNFSPSFCFEVQLQEGRPP